MAKREHYSDEELLRHLDGELVPHDQLAVAEHLKTCWMCRANLAELEAQIHVLARSQREASFPGPSWSAEARWKFSIWREGQETLSRQAPSFAMAANQRRLPATAWMAGAAIMAIIAWAGWRWSGSVAEAEELLTDAIAAEEAIYRQPVHQEFRVMISGQNAVSDPWQGRLQIWSDPDLSRLSAKLTTASGSIRHGVWRADVGEEYVYDPRTSIQPSRRDPPARVAPASVWDFADGANEIEEGFIRWMESRQWRPIAVSDAELLLAGVGGVVVRVESGGIQRELTTVRAEGADGRFVELTIDTSEGLRPRVRKIRLAHPSQSAELVLITDKAELFDGTGFHPAIFQPDPSLYQREVSRTEPPRLPEMRPKTAKLPQRATISPPRPPPAALQATKIEVYYALHEAEACLGEPVHVTSTASGVAVGGLVETVSRKHQLLRVLGALPDGHPVSVEIQSVAEVAVDGDLAMHGTQGQSATVIRALEPPFQQAVESFLQSQSEKTPAEAHEESVGQRATRLSNDAVRWSALLSAHSWSLRRLADVLAADEAEPLAVRSRVLVENMVADHLRAMRASIGTEGRQVIELLTSIEGAGQANGASATDAAARAARYSDGQASLFESVSAMDGMVRMLFAGDVRAAASGTVGPATISNTESGGGAAALLAAIQHVERRLDLLIESPLEVVFRESAVTPQVAVREGGQQPALPQ